MAPYQPTGTGSSSLMLSSNQFGGPGVQAGFGRQITFKSDSSAIDPSASFHSYGGASAGVDAYGQGSASMSGIYSQSQQLATMSAGPAKLPPIGARAGDIKGLRSKLNETWDFKDRMKAIDERIKDYESRHHDLSRKLKGNLVTGNAELAILDKAVKDGEEQMQIQASEVACVDVIKSGAREFIDYALTEVDRIATIDTSSAARSFDWKSQGHAVDIPALRRSEAEKWVRRGGAPKASILTFRAQDISQTMYSTATSSQNDRFSVV
jgi:hypothetical protein